MGGSVTINNSAFSENFVGCCGVAGALYNDGTMTVSNSTLSDNRGIFDGGGIVNMGTLEVSDSTLADNYAGGVPPPNQGVGGAIANYGSLNISNSTLSGNAADSFGGAIFNSGTLAVTNSTLAGNSVGGIYGQSGSATVSATIIADNGGDCFGMAVIDEGYNIDDDGSCGFTSPSISDSSALDGTLGALANNGGPTDTIALEPGSPAIDDVPATDCPATDQRGSPRRPPCDIGAYDTDGILAQTISFTSTPPSPAIVRGPTYAVTATGGGSGNPVTFTSATPSLCAVSGASVSFVGAGTCTIDANQSGNTNYLPATTATQSFSVVNGPDAITSADDATFTVGSTSSFMVNTTGVPTPSIQFKGSFHLRHREIEAGRHPGVHDLC